MNTNPSLDHLCRLTDCFGIIQHADHAVPDHRTGYTTDDNARALMVTTKHHKLYGDTLSSDLSTRYLSFLLYTQRDDGRFRNFLSSDRRYLDEVGSEDCFGRAITSLAITLCDPPYNGLIGTAERMFRIALPHTRHLEHPRGRALALIALYWWATARPEEIRYIKKLARPLADYLVSRYNEHSGKEWDWILPDMTYANAKLPEALFRAYQITHDERYLEVAKDSLDFFCGKAFRNNVLCPVGNNGWFSAKDDEPPLYDQQPIDAAVMVEAALGAFESTGEDEYLQIAKKSLNWFFGDNFKGESLYDEETGGCFDALTETGVNLNRGAESTVCMLIAYLSVIEVEKSLSAKKKETRQISPAMT